MIIKYYTLQQALVNIRYIDVPSLLQQRSIAVYDTDQAAYALLRK